MPSRDIFHVEIMQQFFIMILPPLCVEKIFHRQAVSGKYGYLPRFYSCGCKNCPFCGRKRRVDGDNRSRGHLSSTSGSRYSKEI